MKRYSKDQKLKILVLIIVDALSASLAVYLSVYTRFVIEYSALPIGALDKIWTMIVCWLPINFVIFSQFKLYNRLWEYASIKDAIRVVVAAFCSFIALVIINEALNISEHRSCYPIIWIFSTALVLSTRFFYRIVRAMRNMRHDYLSKSGFKNVMIIGAGSAGNALVREFERDRKCSQYHIVCAIDDDSNKKGKYFGSVKVVGGRNQIVCAAKKYNVDEIIFAIPSANAEERRKIFDICKDTSCVIRALPSYYQLMNGEASISMLKKVRISDLLQREEITFKLSQISDFIENRIVLVTGAGGSIGSELCRQIGQYHPKKLLLFDIYENGVFCLQNELKESFPNLEVITLIGSVRDIDRLDYIFSTYKPDIVYHAAAHKHVPLMEGSPNEAVKNNVFGTLNTVRSADKYGTSHFVLISTDKAVNPTNVMGATKRICEMVIQSYNKLSKTEFVAVRFGNVLGSNGSVVPIFEEQIAQGGPVTVTHPDVIRYFMTIPEAVSLVLQAGATALGGEIFVLDMGEPVKILSLAENMIRLSGHVPYDDIQIIFTGLRPGEKIFEELLMSEEGIATTAHKQIFVGKPIDFDMDAFLKKLEHLRSVADKENYDIRILIKEFVPTFKYEVIEDASETPIYTVSNKNKALAFV